MEEKFEDFENKIGFTFSNKKLLKEAFTHRSYINEHRKEGLESNERLEFLGDAVLELAVTKHLYKKWPDKPGCAASPSRGSRLLYICCAERAPGLRGSQ